MESAFGGHEVQLPDIDEEILDDAIGEIRQNLEEGIEHDKVTPEEMEATLDRITGTTSIEHAVNDAELVNEAIPKRIDLKKETFKTVDEHASDWAILVTNTSSLSVMEIGNVLPNPERFIGLHFFKPAYIIWDSRTDLGGFFVH